MNRIFINLRRLLVLLALCGCFLLLMLLLTPRLRIPAATSSLSTKKTALAPALGGALAGKIPLTNLLDITASAAAAAAAAAAVVPIVHQSWTNAQLPPLFARWSRSFRSCFPAYRHVLWTDADNRRLVASHYPWFLPRFDSYGAGVQKADVSRLFYMYHYGGIYCDLDCECLNNFDHLLVNVSLAFGAMDGKMISSQSDPAYVDEGQIENSFMYSRPKHPFFWDLILRLNATTVGMPIMSSGPYLIMSGIHSARKQGLDKTQIDGRPYLTIYPPKMFNPYSWIRHNSPCKLFGDFTEESLTRCRDAFKAGSYVLQYHTQVWDKGKTNVLQKIKL